MRILKFDESCENVKEGVFAATSSVAPPLHQTRERSLLFSPAIVSFFPNSVRGSWERGLPFSQGMTQLVPREASAGAFSRSGSYSVLKSLH